MDGFAGKQEKRGRQPLKLAVGTVIIAKTKGLPCKWRKRVDFGYISDKKSGELLIA